MSDHKNKAWFEHLAADIYRRSLVKAPDEWRSLIADQLALVYQEGVCDGLYMADQATKAALAKHGGKP